MSDTEFKRICRIVDKYGCAKINDGSGIVEIRKCAMGYSTDYSVWRIGQESNCIDCAWSLDKLKYLFV